MVGTSAAVRVPCNHLAPPPPPPPPPRPPSLTRQLALVQRQRGEAGEARQRGRHVCRVEPRLCMQGGRSGRWLACTCMCTCATGLHRKRSMHRTDLEPDPPTRACSTLATVIMSPPTASASLAEHTCGAARPAGTGRPSPVVPQPSPTPHHSCAQLWLPSTSAPHARTHPPTRHIQVGQAGEAQQLGGQRCRDLHSPRRKHRHVDDLSGRRDGAEAGDAGGEAAGVQVRARV